MDKQAAVGEKKRRRSSRRLMVREEKEKMIHSVCLLPHIYIPIKPFPT